MDHVFSPKSYHLTIGSHDPELIIDSGDKIITRTVDAGGKDFNGIDVSPRGNPQTGPFYVNGAFPGDILAVKFHKIFPNRSHGFCRPKISANVMEPGHNTGEIENEPFNFILDFKNSIAMIENPSKSLENLIVPIRPMIGCFGVAPEKGQSISTATSGQYGGNMDYRGFEPGVIAYLPVFAEGALFHIGDGHAWQSDGEILGTGIEISMDVEFSLTVIKNKEIFWPRGENKDFIFTAGNARPLDEALQHASSEMFRWLVDDYNLSAEDANILLGTYVEYDVGNVFDPAYTMICKISKHVLPKDVKNTLIGQV